MAREIDGNSEKEVIFTINQYLWVTRVLLHNIEQRFVYKIMKNLFKKTKRST